MQFEENFLSLNEPGIGGNLLYTVASGLIYLTALILVETSLLHELKRLWENIFQMVLKKIKRQKASNQMVMVNFDSDVEMEKKQIDELDPKNSKHTNPLIVRRLVKRFGNFTAVNGISYTVQQGQCFGMLGINGAGKTTTFAMITGDETITSGDIFVNGMDLKRHIQRAQQEMGYCPQFDAGLLGYFDVTKL